jgi:hypothetical protein
MPRIRPEDLPSLETRPTSPATLRAKIGEVLINSLSAAARVELVDPATGEYRVVLQGMIDQEENPFDR